MAAHRLRLHHEQLVERGFFGTIIVVTAARHRQEQPDLAVGPPALGNGLKPRASERVLAALQCIDAFFDDALGLLIAQLHDKSLYQRKGGRNNVPTPNLFRSRRD